MQRNFTYIDDAVDAVLRLVHRIPQPDAQDRSERPDTSPAPYRIYNIASREPVHLKDFVRILEDKLGMTARKKLLPMQPGDVPATFADIDDLERDTGYRPRTSVRDGISRFVDWYTQYYQS
jgi:UDP-glucuronate 4-epimerase